MAAKLRLYNSLTRSVEDFVPLAEKRPIGLYTCGPTVYNYLHIGNYRTYLFEDALRRTLQYLGFSLRHVMNITDVGHLTSQADEGEDKMEVGARREGKTAWEIARFYEKTFFEDIARLNIGFHHEGNPNDILCRATEHILEQIELIRRLEKNGFTYRTSDGLYYDTSKFEGYGRLAGDTHIAGIQEGARVRANPQKKNPTDFALWKFAPQGQRQMEWPAPWGWGFPGWHIECSAMAMKYLGESFDIHCGGVDHIPIHHTNEIAQSEAATGKPFVRVWMHGEFLVLNKAKMAKSTGGFIRLQDLSDKGFDPLDYRYLCLTAHYRKQLDFSWEALEAAKTARTRLRETASEWLRCEKLEKEDGSLSARTPERGGSKNKGMFSGPESQKVRERLDAFRQDIANDLNMPEALSSVYKALASLGKWRYQLAFLREADKVLGLGLADAPKEDALSSNLQALFDRYVAARAKKDFAASDALRKSLAECGIRVVDTPAGSHWKRIGP